jgi:hypothetical protein
MKNEITAFKRQSLVLLIVILASISAASLVVFTNTLVGLLLSVPIIVCVAIFTIKNYDNGL